MRGLLFERVLRLLVNFLLIAAIFRASTLSEFGEASLALSLLLIGSSFASFGGDLSQQVRGATSSSSEAAIAEALSIRFWSTPLVTAIAGAILFAYQTSFFHAALTLTLMALIFLLNVSDTVESCLLRTQSYKSALKIRYVILFLSASTKIAYIALDIPGTWLPIVLLIEPLAASLIFLGSVPTKQIVKLLEIRPGPSFSQFKRGRFDFGSMLFTLASTRSDILICNFLFGAQATGLYAATAKIPESFAAILNAISGAIGNRLMAKNHTNRERLLTAFRLLTSYILLAGAISSVIFLIGGDKILTIAFDSQLDGMGSSAAILLFAAACGQATICVSRLMIFDGLDSQRFLRTVCSFLVMIIALLILAPGGNAMSIATVVLCSQIGALVFSLLLGRYPVFKS